MRTKLFGMAWLFVIFASGVSNGAAKSDPYVPPASDRLRVNLDKGWRFINRDFPAEEETHQVNQLPWRNVDLPHEWTIAGPYDRHHNTTQAFLPMDIGWYRKGLRFPESYADKKLLLVFDGVYRASDVWMNYAHLGHHDSGYTSFAYDITDYVRTGNRVPNGLRVRVDGRRHEEDMYEGNGIYRHVWLVVTNKLHIALWGTFVTTPTVAPTSTTVNVATTVKNEHGQPRPCTLITRIVNATGDVVAEVASVQTIPAHGEYLFSQVARLSHAHLWDVDDPYLYRVHSTVLAGNLVADTDETAFGIRTFRFDANAGFFLNGRHLKLRGFNAHHDFAGLGTAIPDRIHWNAMMAMKKAGFNFYRSAHNPATPERLDVCDRIGMLVWDEIERKLESHEVEQRLVRDTIVRDRNHPSVILWSLENESPLESTIHGTRIIRAATALAHRLDTTRPTTFAASMPVNKHGYGDAADVVSYNYDWQRADRDHRGFPHWKIGLLSEFSATRAQRGGYGIQRFSRAGNDSYFDLYNGSVQTMYVMCTRVEDYWQRIRARRYLGGGCLWSGIDYWGEGNAWPLVSRGDGAIDVCHFPKDAYYYFASQWTAAPMVHVFPHWNWQGREGKPIKIWCYTNCDQVELFLNNRSLGKQRCPKPPVPGSADEPGSVAANPRAEHLEWQVPYEPGVLRAVGTRGGKVVCRQEVHTAGKPARIMLSRVMAQFLAENRIPPLIADDRDIAVVKAAIVDAQGWVVPTADNLVTFRMEAQGKGRILGVGNGDIASHEANHAAHRHAYHGLCAAVVRPAPQPGDWTVVATAPGLQPGRMRLTTVWPEPVMLIVDAVPASTCPGGKVTVTVTVADRFGEVITAGEKRVTLAVTGPATFADGEKTIAKQAVHGKVTVPVVSQGKPGSMTITARMERVLPGRVHVVVKAQ